MKTLRIFLFDLTILSFFVMSYAAGNKVSRNIFYLKSVELKVSSLGLEKYIHNNWTFELKNYKRNVQLISWDFILKKPLEGFYVSLINSYIFILI